MINKALLQSSLLCFIAFSSNGQGPKTPPCGIAEVKTNEVIAGVKFPKGKYKINIYHDFVKIGTTIFEY